MMQYVCTYIRIICLIKVTRFAQWALLYTSNFSTLQPKYVSLSSNFLLAVLTMHKVMPL